MHLRRLMPLGLALIAAAALFAAACGDDDDGDDAAANAADEKYLEQVCTAFDAFLTKVSDDPESLSDAFRTFGDDLAKADPPGDYKKSHEKLVKTVKDANGDLNKIATLGSDDVPDKKADARLAEKAEKIPACQKAGVFQ